MTTAQPGGSSDEAPSGERRGLRLALVLGLLGLLAAAVLVTLYLTRGGQSGAAARLPALATPAAGLLQGDVQQADGATVTLSTPAGRQSLTIGSGTRVEALLPATPDAIAVGDDLTVGGVPNQVNSFAIKLVVDIPQGSAGPARDGVATSDLGFTGWEAYGDPAQMPEVSGQVTAIDAAGVHIVAPSGDVTVRIDNGSALRRLSTGGVELIHGGDHLAAKGGGTPTAVLVLPGD